MGTEILFVLALGLLVLGPKRLHAMLGSVARAKAQFEEASRRFQSQPGAEHDEVQQGAANPATGL
jgi:Sec-independent protein translocase protein TatA